MSLEDSCRQAVDYRFRDGAHDLGRHRPEILPGFRAERNRSVTIVENPISREDLRGLLDPGRYAIPLGLWKIIPYRRPIHGVSLSQWDKEKKAILTYMTTRSRVFV